LRIGHIVKIFQNDPFPCDLLILNTSEDNNICFIESQNIDGETNLKIKQADPNLAKYFSNFANVSYSTYLF